MVSGYELPKSKYQSREVVPPEVEDLVALLNSAADHIPDVASISFQIVAELRFGA